MGDGSPGLLRSLQPVPVVQLFLGVLEQPTTMDSVLVYRAKLYFLIYQR